MRKIIPINKFELSRLRLVLTKEGTENIQRLQLCVSSKELSNSSANKKSCLETIHTESTLRMKKITLKTLLLLYSH